VKERTVIAIQAEPFADIELSRGSNWEEFRIETEE